MPKRIPGLTKRGAYWHINKVIKGRRLYESTGTNDQDEAERYLAKRVHEIREQLLYGRRTKHTFMEAATKYLSEETKTSLWRDANSLKVAVPYIGHMSLDQVHMDSLRKFISARQKGGIKNTTINRDLAIIRRILILAARVWRDESGMTWLAEAPLIRLLKNDDRKPRPISLEEERHLLQELPEHHRAPVLFALNTGCRHREVTQLRWAEERPDLGGFVLAGDRTKNGQVRFIPLNTVAKRVINAQRGGHDEYVFTFKGEPMWNMGGKAWRAARKRAGLADVRIHDLRHTFGHRLRAARVCFEDRQDLLGHKSSRITDHYCQADVEHLIEAVERLVNEKSRNSRVISPACADEDIIIAHNSLNLKEKIGSYGWT